VKGEGGRRTMVSDRIYLGKGEEEVTCPKQNDFLSKTRGKIDAGSIEKQRGIKPGEFARI